MSELTHLDKAGKVHIVDISDKAVTQRVALAQGYVAMQSETLQMILDNGFKKGDVLAVARIAGIQAAKKTSELIPLCHPLMLTSVKVDITPEPDQGRLRIESRCKVGGQTGVEMEALTAVSAAALTIYDMCKAVDKGMVIEGIVLLEKSGGQSGDWKR